MAMLDEAVLLDVPPWSFNIDIIMESDSSVPLEVVVVEVFDLFS